MTYDFMDVLIPHAQIQARVAELGAQISADYSGKDLTVIGILKGSVLFMADLIRAISMPLAIDFMAVTSYGASTTSSGNVRILKDLDCSITGRHLLIVEDIIDSGLTMQYLLNNLASRGAASLRVCTLLDKPERRLTDVRADYTGFAVPNEFVVGYGLDYNQMYRNLPDIGVLHPEIYTKAGE
ncbi:MAG TPA: hypoxanthine phosphoribosyltransferase [Candidatus Ornithocaccomicrobium faecavium]|uniref:Hypoxanthine phosphoribosyltransferase n=1 Tax=Candidatus Ornithocaccomicrobium faecavium TaxID=2840890 RepID=A0A9D1P8F0_9FIRM|nr:hypoxanthine phosphoribosyltransferase [Candidatus Ornithocaccomicrobium faecavium]